MIAAALGRAPGVAHVDVHPGMDHEKITQLVCQQLTAIGPFFASTNFELARRVVKWYNRVPFLDKPIVVLEAGERAPDDEHAQLQAVKVLQARLPVRFVIDGCDNSVPDAAINTIRVLTMNVEELDKAPSSEYQRWPRCAPRCAKRISIKSSSPCSAVCLRTTARCARSSSQAASIWPTGFRLKVFAYSKRFYKK